MSNKHLVVCALLVGWLSSDIAFSQTSSKNKQEDTPKTSAEQDSSRYWNQLDYYQNLDAAQWNMNLGNYQRANAYYQLMQAAGETVSPYWIGVQCEPAGEVPILSDIPVVGTLFHKGGLRINSVTGDTPAQAAGLKEGDYIIAIAGQPVNQIADLVTAIGEAKESEIQITIVRASDSKNHTVVVTPVERPQQKSQNMDQAANTARTWLQYSQLFDPAIQQAVSPYTAQTYYAVLAQSLPDDVELTLRKKGSGPASITLRRGEQEWVVEEAADLADLPDDVRAIATALHTTMQGQITRYWNAVPYRSQPWVYATQGSQSDDKAELLKRIEGLSKQLDALRSSVDALNDK